MSLSRLPLLAWLALLPACDPDRWGFGGQEGEDEIDTAIADTADGTGDTATDTDETDSDSGSDSDTTGTDTGSVAPFEGPFVVTATDASGATDTCSGTASITRTDTTLAGSASCVFSGPLAAAYPKGLGAAIDGTTTAGSAAGTITFTVGASGSLAWSGTVDATTLDGAFSGTIAPLTLDGSFDTTR